MSPQLEATNQIIGESSGIEQMRRRIGRYALEQADAFGEDATPRWRATVSARIPARIDPEKWPDTYGLVLTAVNATTGEPVLFTRDSGVAVVDALAASCSSGFAYRIGKEFFIDGGYRTNADNADLAAGYAQVVVLSPFGGRTRTPERWGVTLARQVADLEAHGSRVRTIFPNAETEALFGGNMMDVSKRPAVARAGFAHAEQLVPELNEFWG